MRSHVFHQTLDPELDARAGTRVHLIGHIDEIEERAHNQRTILYAHTLIDGEDRIPIHEKIHVSFDYGTTLDFGDEASVQGVLKKPEGFITDTGRLFAYDQFLAKDTIYATISFAEVNRESVGRRTVRSRLILLKKNMRLRILRIFPEKEGSFLVGIILGEKHFIHSDVQTSFRKSGLIHILVLSGFHITMISLAILWCMRLIFPLRLALAINGIIIVLFILMVGASATIIRAGGMAMIALIARILEREHIGMRGLLMVGTGMMIHNPRILLWDVSFQLSFLATLGLIIYSPFFAKKLQGIPQFFNIRETMSATLSAQIFVTPLIMYQMGEISLISIIANVLIVPLTAFSMIFGSIAGITGEILPILQPFIRLPAYASAHLQITGAEIMGSLPFASIYVPRFSFFFLVIIYIPILWISWYVYKKQSTP